MSFTVREHRVRVPLDHAGTEASRAADRAAGLPDTIEVFAREVIGEGGENRPHLLYLQGGPGCPAPRLGSGGPAWLGDALAHFRVVLLDQRGTGASTPPDPAAIAGLDDAALARWLELLRADQIVADAEVLREAVTGGEPWWTLGQSYGGFITLAYLSRSPEGLRGCYVTGGLPGLAQIDDLYRDTYRLTAARNREVYAAHPTLERWVRAVAAHVSEVEERLPSGEVLTPRRLRGIGVGLGTQSGTGALLDLTCDRPFIEGPHGRRLSGPVLATLGQQLSYASAPLYAAIHETIYAAATEEIAGKATAWSAHRLAGVVEDGFADTDPRDEASPYYLFGEHMSPEVFLTDPALQPYAGAAQILADKTDWPVIYDTSALAGIGRDIPIAAAVYTRDMFVPREHSLATAALLGASVWENDYLHDGLRQADAHVLARLMSSLGTPAGGAGA